MPLDWSTNVAILLSLVALIGLVLLVAQLVHQNRALRQYSEYYVLATVYWFGILFFVSMNEDMFPPADSVKHVALGRMLSSAIERGDFETVAIYAEPGNDAFRLLIGIYFFATNADPFSIRVFSICSGLAGVIFLTDIASRLNGFARLPSASIMTILFLPSFPFWACDILKDGFTFGCNCCIGQLLFKSQLPAISRASGWIGLAGLSLLRPHHALCWFFALALAPALTKGQYTKAIAFTVLGALCGAALYTLIPDIADRMLESGATETMDEEFQRRMHMGGSAIGDSNPIPFVTGFYLLFFRPLPGELPGLAGLICSVEVMWLCTLGLWSLFHVKSIRAVLSSQPIVGLLIALVMYCGLFTYTYNLGLLVRTRISAMPCFLAAITPILSGALFRSTPLRSPPRRIAHRRFVPRPASVPGLRGRTPGAVRRTGYDSARLNIEET